MTRSLDNDFTRILRTLEEQFSDDELLSPITETKKSHPSDEGEIENLHVFPVEGGILILKEQPPIVESDPVTKIPPQMPLPPKFLTVIERNPFPAFILILCLFLCFDALNSYISSLIMPTAVITI